MGRGSFLFVISPSPGLRNCTLAAFSFRSIIGLWHIIISISRFSEVFGMGEKRKEQKMKMGIMNGRTNIFSSTKSFHAK